MESKPNIIKTENVTVDLCFHPTKDVLAAGDIEEKFTSQMHFSLTQCGYYKM
jgi:hypothetical protein